jgi:transcriptional regulator with XRE-family HTH domain
LSKASSWSHSNSNNNKHEDPSVKEIGKALKVGAVAQRLGISATMVRSFEYLGIAKPARSSSKYRLYTNEDLKILQRAIYLQRIQGLRARAILSQLRQEGLLENRTAGLTGDEVSIGPRLRKLRLLRGKSLSSVAEAVGVADGFLSNLERSRYGASIAILGKLARYYGVNVSDLIQPIDTTGPLVRPQDRKRLPSGPGIHVEMLASGKISMEPHLFHIAPRARSGELYSHEGEQFVYVVRGRLNIILGTEEFQLRTGCSFYFNSNIQHRWSNPGKTQSIVLWINTPSSI